MCKKILVLLCITLFTCNVFSVLGLGNLDPAASELIVTVPSPTIIESLLEATALQSFKTSVVGHAGQQCEFSYLINLFSKDDKQKAIRLADMMSAYNAYERELRKSNTASCFRMCSAALGITVGMMAFKSANSVVDFQNSIILGSFVEFIKKISERKFSSLIPGAVLCAATNADVFRPVSVVQSGRCGWCIADCMIKVIASKQALKLTLDAAEKEHNL